MMIRELHDKKIAILAVHERINGSEDLLDLLADVGYRHKIDRFVLDQASLPERFFDLSSGIAGELLQKCSNYRISVAIIGKFSRNGSKSLRDFIRESNRGGQVLFVEELEQALDLLAR